MGERFMLILMMCRAMESNSLPDFSINKLNKRMFNNLFLIEKWLFSRPDDRLHCRGCHLMFLLNYPYEARKLGVKEQITNMAFNSVSV